MTLKSVYLNVVHLIQIRYGPYNNSTKGYQPAMHEVLKVVNNCFRCVSLLKGVIERLSEIDIHFLQGKTGMYLNSDSYSRKVIYFLCHSNNKSASRGYLYIEFLQQPHIFSNNVIDNT